MIVTFFGHSNTPQSAEIDLENTIIDLIEKQFADTFYVGTHGNFDTYANNILKKISKKYPNIKHFTVLAYMPQTNELPNNFSNTILPESVAKSHPKYAISKRNDWMLDKSDIIITYITHQYGGAAKYYNKALRQNKKVINIANKKAVEL